MKRCLCLALCLCLSPLIYGEEAGADGDQPMTTPAPAEGESTSVTEADPGAMDDAVADGEDGQDAEGGGDGDGEEDGEQDAQALLDEVSESLDVKQQALYAQAEAWYLKARSLLQAARFPEAREAIAKAVRLFPAHQKAQELQQEILGILAVRDNRLQMAATWLAAIGAVRIQEEAMEIARLLKQGDQHMDAGEYREAFNAYDKVAIKLDTFPYQFDWKKLPEVVAAKKLASKAKARQDAIRRDRETRRRAQAEAERRSEMEEEVLEKKVDTILRRAMAAYKRKHYRRAEISAWNAYQMDRRRDDARALYLDAREKAHVQFDEHYRQERLEGLARVNEEIHMALIPQYELLTFPEDWFRRSLRQAQEIDDEEEEPWVAQIHNRLEQEVTFNWVDEPIEDVIGFLRRTTGVNFVIDREVYTNPPPPITLTAENMKLKTALRWITQMTRLNMSIRNQAVLITNREQQGETYVKLYDIGDLISPVQDFPAEDLGFTQGGGGAGGGGGGFNLFGGGGGGGGGDGERETLEADDIMDFIRSAVFPETWEQPSVAMDLRQGGTLFVSQASRVHDGIEDLLTRLRNRLTVQVRVRIRLLDIEKSFVEEIGIEWNDLSNDILNTNTQSGALDVKREWGYSGTLDNQLPANAASTGFANTFGSGVRTEWAYNLAGILNRPQVNGVLEALERESDSQQVNAPEVTCFNGQRANAVFLQQYAYIADYAVTGESNYDPEVEVLNFGDIIDVRPLVSADRKYVTLEVRPTSVLLKDVFVERVTTVRQVNGVVFNSVYPVELPNIEVRSLRTTCMLPDKGSLLLGGYVRGLRQRTHSGIPVLSHIPFLGRLFGKNGIYDENRHLFFLVSVEILDLGEREAMQ